MADVFLIRGTYKDFLQNPQKILEGMREADFLNTIQENELIGLKIHFGEKGNQSHISPRFLSPLAKFLKKKKTKAFLFETNTLYRGERLNSVDHIHLAHNHGFKKPGLPIIIGDGLKGNNFIEVNIQKKHFQTCYLAEALKDMDAMIVLSHFTGHMLTGFGASVKNLGMGCASRRGKMAQHCTVSPKINSETCVLCGACADICPVNAIERGEDSFFIHEEICIGCAQCISVCPQKSVNIVWSEAYEDLGEKIAEYALAVTRQVPRCLYINFCLFMTQECDCMNQEEQGFIPDLGILFSHDPVSLDKACIDTLINREKRDVLKALHPQISYLHHLTYAQELGLGSLEYTLKEL